MMSLMKRTQTETSTPRRRRYRFWLGCFTLLLVMPLLLYYGYCWGLWGRNSLLLQYLFQCSCPPASEEARYSEHIDVIIPACSQARVRLSPSGMLLHVREKESGIATAYLLNLQTMEKIDVSNLLFPSFLTDDLWFVGNGLDGYILDRITGMQYPIQKFVYSRSDAKINGETNLALLAESLRQAEYIFLIGPSQDTVIALTSDFRTNPERNFLTNRFDISDFNMERFLQENNIIYRVILPDFPHEAISPDGKLIARDDGIYLVETGQIIAQAPPSLVRGWIWDSRGVIYSSNGRCLMRRVLLFVDDVECAIVVPQPVLLLKMPDEYLTPTQMP